MADSTKLYFGLIDYSAERSGVTVYLPELDASNYAALFGVGGRAALLQTELEIITGLTRTGTSATVPLAPGSDALPANVNAQREIAVRVSYQDDVTGKKYRFDIPGPVDALYPPQGTDVIPLDNVLAAAFIAVFEAQAVSVDGNAITITGLRLVGRNN